MANSVIGALRVMLGMDTAEFEEGADSASRRATRMERDFARMGQNLQRTGRNLTIGLTAPLTAFGVSAFSAASDAAELQSAFDQTFGELSGTMNAWAEETGNAMGRSTQSMQEMANTFGIFFNQAAPTREAAAEMSQTFAVLAQDLASFYNVAESDALQKLRSGLAGEAEPLRDFGVFLSAAAVEAKALEMGLADASGEISEQAKIMARYQLILESTSNAQGDVMRTSDGTANEVRRMQDAFEELQVAIGQKLLPAFTPLIEGLGVMLDRFSKLPDGMQTAIVVAGALAAALGPVLMAVGGLIQMGAPLIAGFSAMGGALGGLAPLLGTLGAALVPLLPVLAAVAAAGALIYANWDTISPMLSDLWAKAQETLGPPLREMVTALSDLFTAFWNGPLGDMVRMAGDVLGEFASLAVQILGERLVSTLEFLIDVAGRVFSGIAGAIRAVSGVLTGDWQMAWQGALAIFEAIVPGITTAVSMIYNAVKTWLQDRLGAVFDWVAEKVEFVEQQFAWLYDRVVGNSWIPDMVDEIGQHMFRLEDNMVRPAEDAARRTDDVFADASTSVQNSFAEMANGALGHLQRLVGAIKGGGFLDIVQAGLGTLQGFGMFGGSQGGGFTLPAFANGGSMMLGGFGGIDSNVLSLNGSPIARVSRGEVATITPANDRGGMGGLNVTVTMDRSTGELGAFVADTAGQMLAQATPALVAAGGQDGVRRMQQMQERAL